MKQADNRSNLPLLTPELKSFLAKFFLGMHKKTRELKRLDRSRKIKHHLSYRILMFLVINPNVRKAEIIKGLRSNHTSVSASLENLRLDGNVLEELVSEYRTKNKIKFQSCRYRISAKGDSFIRCFLDEVIDDTSMTGDFFA